MAVQALVQMHDARPRPTFSQRAHSDDVIRLRYKLCNNGCSRALRGCLLILRVLDLYPILLLSHWAVQCWDRTIPAGS